MKRFWSAVTVAALLVVAVAEGVRFAVDNTVPIVNKAAADAINQAGLTWRASHDNGIRVNGATRAEIKKLLGVKPHLKRILPRREFSAKELASAVPAEFDSATNWPHCPTITHIRDQSACGSCWAVAAAEAMSDRYCTGGVSSDLLISAANLLECCWYCGSGCDGGDPGMAWAFWTSTGLPSDACQPYPFPKCEHHIPKNHYPVCPKTMYPTPACHAGCNDGSNYTLHQGQQSYALSGEADFQKELMAHGPFEVAFDVYSDFPLYKGGVYTQHSDDYLGGHAVRVVGWGTLNGTPYWKIANSWNTDWGLDGYFLIKRGSDECGIEDNGAAGIA